MKRATLMLLDRTLKVQSAGNSRNSNGTISSTPVDRITGIEASIQPLSGNKLFSEGHPGIESTHAAYLADPIAVLHGDLIVDDDDVSYELLFWDLPTSQMAAYQTLYMKRRIE